jgi:hypothetical protein
VIVVGLHQSEVILQATKKAMPDHAKVLLVEYTVPTGPQPSMAKALDLRTRPPQSNSVLVPTQCHGQ